MGGEGRHRAKRIEPRTHGDSLDWMGRCIRRPSNRQLGDLRGMATSVCSIVVLRGPGSTVNTRLTRLSCHMMKRSCLLRMRRYLNRRHHMEGGSRSQKGSSTMTTMLATHGRESISIHELHGVHAGLSANKGIELALGDAT